MERMLPSVPGPRVQDPAHTAVPIIVIRFFPRSQPTGTPSRYTLPIRTIRRSENMKRLRRTSVTMARLGPVMITLATVLLVAAPLFAQGASPWKTP